MVQQRNKKPRGEVHEVIAALEHLSTQNGSRPDVVQSKRECFQKLIRYMTQARVQGWGQRVVLGQNESREPAVIPVVPAHSSGPGTSRGPLSCCTAALLGAEHQPTQSCTVVRPTRYPPPPTPPPAQGIDMSLAFVPATKCAALSKFDLPLK